MENLDESEELTILSSSPLRACLALSLVIGLDATGGPQGIPLLSCLGSPSEKVTTDLAFNEGLISPAKGRKTGLGVGIHLRVEKPLPPVT